MKFFGPPNSNTSKIRVGKLHENIWPWYAYWFSPAGWIYYWTMVDCHDVSWMKVTSLGMICSSLNPPPRQAAKEESEDQSLTSRRCWRYWTETWRRRFFWHRFVGVNYNPIASMWRTVYFPLSSYIYHKNKPNVNIPVLWMVREW